ncbi:MAG TPA: PEP-CTERM sorting domain-containing protein [Candidatus Acidoferrales bacterium]|nr:PEP-CTERM sorting domain-containing protein [Candidatus Acidoferrales bacterium]
MIAAVPVWADKISVTDVAKESPGIESPVKAVHHPDLSLNVLLAFGFPAGSTQAVTLIDTFETNDAFAEEQPKVEVPVKMMRRSGLQVIASVNAESLPEFTPESVLNGGVPSSDSSDFWGPWFSQPKTKFSRFLPESNTQPAGVSQTDSYKAGSFISHVWESWRTEGRGSTGNYGNTNLTENTLAPAVHVVPEPGSLSLMLLGLAAVGFFGRRRGQPLIPV